MFLRAVHTALSSNEVWRGWIWIDVCVGENFGSVLVCWNSLHNGTCRLLSSAWQTSGLISVSPLIGKILVALILGSRWKLSPISEKIKRQENSLVQNESVHGQMFTNLIRGPRDVETMGTNGFYLDFEYLTWWVSLPLLNWSKGVCVQSIAGISSL